MQRVPLGIACSICAVLAAVPSFPQDLDDDGWSVADGDCHDVPTAACWFPSLVNPGALEIPGNGVDDDCDGTLDEISPACSVVTDMSGVTAVQLAEALELCETTTAFPPLSQRRWGLISAQHLFADGSTPGAADLADMQNFQTAVLADYGTGGIAPVAGATMAALSSGRARDKNDPGYVAPSPGTNWGNPGSPPADFVAAHGGALPGGGCCGGPGAVSVNDSVNLKLRLRVPTNADGLRLRVRFANADFGSWVCTPYDDYALVLIDSGAPGIPADKNIALDDLGGLLSLNTAFWDSCVPQGCFTCPAGTLALVGTGLELGVGAATKWLEIASPVIPGEEITLRILVFDGSDGIGDSLLLVDGLAWDLVPPCPPGASSEVVRLGTPPNPNAFLPGVTGGPVLGTIWHPVVSHASFLPSAVLDFAAFSATPISLPVGPLGTLLCALPHVGATLVPAGTPFGFYLPVNCAWVGLQLCCAAGSINAAGTIQLTNALDITLGSY
jgi:hypothetical protein